MRRAHAWLLVAWAVALAALTLAPVPSVDRDDPMSTFCLICGERGTADAALNLVLFAPLGALLPRRRRAVTTALLMGLGVSLAVELLQLVVPGRHAALGDVVWNGLGAAVGALAAGVVAQLPGARPATAGGIAAAMVAAWFLLAGFLLEHAPTGADYYGQWTADLGHMPRYEGELLAATLDGLPVPDTRFPREARVAERLTEDWVLAARIVKGAAPEAVSPIVSIYDAQEVEILLLGAHGEDLVLRERTRATRLRLDQPDLRLPGALTIVDAGDTLLIGARRSGHHRCLSVGAAMTCALGLTPGRTWSLLLHPETRSVHARGILDALWMFWLLVPLGLLTPSARRLATSAVLVAVSIALGVALTRLMTPTWWEVAAAAAGLLGGRLTLGGLVARARARS